MTTKAMGDGSASDSYGNDKENLCKVSSCDEGKER